MSLARGDHLVIKRRGLILTPDANEAYHEFEVVDPSKESRLVWADGIPCPTGGEWYVGKTLGKDYFTEYVVQIKVIR